MLLNHQLLHHRRHHIHHLLLLLHMRVRYHRALKANSKQADIFPCSFRPSLTRAVTVYFPYISILVRMTLSHNMISYQVRVDCLFQVRCWIDHEIVYPLASPLQCSKHVARCVYVARTSLHNSPDAHILYPFTAAAATPCASKHSSGRGSGGAGRNEGERRGPSTTCQRRSGRGEARKAPPEPHEEEGECLSF